MPVVRAFRVGDPGIDVPAACRTLQGLLDELLAEPGVFESPDDRSGVYLRKAYHQFLEMARACRMGEDSRVRAELAKAEQTLGQAAQALAPYGVRP